MADDLSFVDVPEPLVRFLEPWARAVADPATAGALRLRELAQNWPDQVRGWVDRTPEIDATLDAAAYATATLADALDRRREAADAALDAGRALARLTAALRSARPDRKKAALGLGW